MDRFHEDADIFAMVVDKGGFSHAAKHLGISPALVSRRIKQLEKKLQVTLLTRSTRAFELTAEGAVLYQHAKKVLVDKQTTLSAIEALSKKPTGLVRISAPVNFGRQYLMPELSQFMRAYPSVELDLTLSNEPFDMISDKFDLIIRGAGYLGQDSLPESALIAKTLLKSKIILCASQEYILNYLPLNNLASIAGLKGIHFSPTAGDFPSETTQWTGKENHRVVTVNLNWQFSCNDIDTTINMALEGHGIIKVPELSVKKQLHDKTLVHLLPTVDFGKYQLFILFPQRVLPERTRVLVHFLQQYWEHRSE